MKKLLILAILGISMITGSSLFALNQGKILRLDYCSANDYHHTNIVQVVISGGCGIDGYNSGFAAVRVEDYHLVMALMDAKKNNKEITVYLDPNDVYFTSPDGNEKRFVIMRISIVE